MAAPSTIHRSSSAWEAAEMVVMVIAGLRTMPNEAELKRGPRHTTQHVGSLPFAGGMDLEDRTASTALRNGSPCYSSNQRVHKLPTVTCTPHAQSSKDPRLNP